MSLAIKEQPVAIVHPWPNFDAVPSLYGAAELLSGRGYLVDIFTSVSPEFATPVFHDGRINLRISRSDGFCGDLARRHRSATERLQRTGLRSEERRVGKECRSRWSPYH